MIVQSETEFVFECQMLGLWATSRQFADCHSMQLLYRKFPHYVDLFRFGGGFASPFPVFKRNTHLPRPVFFVAFPVVASESPLSFDDTRFQTVLGQFEEMLRLSRYSKMKTLGIVLLKNDDPEGKLIHRLTDAFKSSAISVRAHFS